ncbi:MULTISPECIES: PQQ-binding-like beta-propeller repeat protein [unclassified Streptomyces]|uniref:outer membrane protein assembly factor BamB family protein n=1 Tax=unclassified Streptomyces TaxID=2593676 RepID=UPI0033FEFD2C
MTADSARRRRRRRLFGVGAVVTILALCAGGWLVWPDRDDQSQESGKPSANTAPQGRLDIRETVEKPPKSTTGRMAFRFSVDDMRPGEEYEMPGSWATDKVLAKGIGRTLVGFKMGADVTTDDEIWRLPLSGPICGVTRHVTVEGRTAVLHRNHKNPKALCDHVTFVDLDSGKKLWDKEFPASDSVFGVDAMTVTMTRATVAVTWDRGSAAYDMDRGTRLWKNTKTSGCDHQGLAGGRALLMLMACFADDEMTYRVRNVNPRTGAAEWTYRVTDGVKDVALLSAEPAVLGVSAGEIGVTHLISLDHRGKRRTTIGLQGGRFEVKCRILRFQVVDDCPSTVVTDDQVFVTSRERDNSNWILSFDLATGKAVKKFDSGRNRLIYPLRTSGKHVLAFRDSDDHITPMEVVSLDPRTGKETPYFSFGLPPEAWTLTSQELADIFVQNGRIFFSSARATGPDDKDGRWSWLVLGVGSDRASSN